MLFIGCEIPDWVGRFLLRMSNKSRLLAGRKQFFVFSAAQPRTNRRCRISLQRIVVSSAK